jgi:hypothetical protein
MPLGTSVLLELKFMTKQFAVLAPVEQENASPETDDTNEV